jgi:antitoxin component of RelBE/YafQ-DinJ toxin-antitoxin module
MEKEIRISMRIDKELKQAFFALCEERDQTPSKVIKRLMQNYVEQDGKREVVAFMQQKDTK